jgi:hypothetical protein
MGTGGMLRYYSLSKSGSLNNYLESYLHEYHFLYLFILQQFSLTRILESHSHI